MARPEKCFALYSIATACDNSRLKHDWLFGWVFKSEWQSRQANSSARTLFVSSSLGQLARLRQSIQNLVSEIKPVSKVAVCLLFLPSLLVIVPGSPFAWCLVLAARCLLRVPQDLTHLTGIRARRRPECTGVSKRTERRVAAVIRVTRRSGDSGVDECR